MEIKIAFSSQFNHDAAIRGFWCAEHVCYSSRQSINETKKRENLAAYLKGDFDIPALAYIGFNL